LGQKARVLLTLPTPLKDFQQPPALPLAERSGFHNAYPIPYSGLIMLIMNVVLFRAANSSLVQRMANQTLHRNHDGFIHPVTDHSSFPYFAPLAFSVHS